MSIEKQLPLRWFSVPQIVAELKAFTNRQIRTRVAPKRIRNNVTFTNKKYVRFDEHKEKEFNTLKRKLKNIYHETHPAEHLRISFFFDKCVHYCSYGEKLPYKKNYNEFQGIS